MPYAEAFFDGAAYDRVAYEEARCDRGGIRGSVLRQGWHTRRGVAIGMRGGVLQSGWHLLALTFLSDGTLQLS